MDGIAVFFIREILKKIIKNKKGFTLMEMVVAIGIFSVAILSATAIFNMAIESQRSAVSAQELQENLRYALEFMGKELRGADGKIECDGLQVVFCYNFNSNPLINTNVLSFNKDLNFGMFYLKNNRIMYDWFDQQGYITPASIKVNSLNFIVHDDGLVFKQPRVTMAIDVEAIGKSAHRQKLNLQTTISSRYYE